MIQLIVISLYTENDQFVEKSEKKEGQKDGRADRQMINNTNLFRAFKTGF